MVNVPVVANTQLVTGVHRATTLALNLPTVSQGALQSVAGQTIYATTRIPYTETLVLANDGTTLATANLSTAGLNTS